MMINLKSLVLTTIILVVFSNCTKGNETGDIKPDVRSDLVITSEVINPSFVGNGVQWGGYENMKDWTGKPSLSDSDWEKLYQRVRYMRPPLVRIMVSSGWSYMTDNRFDPSKSEPVLFKILDFCQAEGIAVMFGEWGHIGGTSIDTNWLENSAKFIEYLLKTKGYSCIKYFNMVNEPNGDWSSINGNYPLWKELIEKYYAKLVDKGVASNVKLIGPDIAIWDINSTWWIADTKNDLGDKIGAFDIHTYPTETTVREASYQTMINAYKNAAPSGKEMLMGELGFKYSPESALGKENVKRIAADKYASEDSNMMIYDSFYGVDMADAIIQNMRVGYGGVIMWMLDDAMYTKENNTKLKRWGFWNSLGAEKFGNADDENIRPWFYPMSLICRYFPQGTKIYKVNQPDKLGLRAVAGEKNGKYTIAISNSHMAGYTINLRMINGIELQNAKVYTYVSKQGSAFDGAVDENDFAKPKDPNVSVNLKDDNFKQLEIPAQSFCLITNMD